jgi:hypothetical protein
MVTATARLKSSPVVHSEIMLGADSWVENIDLTTVKFCRDYVFDDKHPTRIGKVYQRVLKPSVINKIVENYCSVSFGLPLIGVRADGTRWGVDAQQRITAKLRMAERDPENADEHKMARCLMFASEGVAHEAAVFVRINKNRVNVGAQELFIADLAKKDPRAISVLKTVRSCGFDFTCLSNKTGYPNFRAVKAVQNIVSDGGIAQLKTVLDLIQKAWSGKKEALQDDIPRGLSYFLTVFDGRVNLHHLLKRMKRVTPEKVIDAIEGQSKTSLRKLKSGDRYKVAAKCFLDLYNNRVGVGKFLMGNIPGL